MSGLRPACAHCVYWMTDQSSTTPTAGHCHRYPPGIYISPSGTVVQKFPMTDRNAWCGEWSDDDSYLREAAYRAIARHT